MAVYKSTGTYSQRVSESLAHHPIHKNVLLIDILLTITRRRSDILLGRLTYLSHRLFALTRAATYPYHAVCHDAPHNGGLRIRKPAEFICVPACRAGQIGRIGRGESPSVEYRVYG